MQGLVYRKFCTVAIVVLFIGVGIIPSISGSIGELSTASLIEEVSDISLKLKETNENDIASYDESAVFETRLFDADNSFGKTIYVDDDNTEGPWDGTEEHPYQYIQDAVDNASDGDTVFVCNGTYDKTNDSSIWHHENVFIYKPINLIGESKENTIIDGRESTILRIESSSFTIKYFTLKNAYNGGIFFNTAILVMKGPHPHIENICISDCIINNNGGGIGFACDVSNISITNCGIYDNLNGICTEMIENVTVSNCVIWNNRNCGIDFCGTDISISNCYITDSYCGVALEGNSKNIATSYGNIFGQPWEGIVPEGNMFGKRQINEGMAAKNIDIHHNKIQGNSFMGIIAGGFFSDSCFIRNNTIHNNGIEHEPMIPMHAGICLLSDGLTVEHNTISSNKMAGIFLFRSSNNKIIENNIMDSEYDGFFYQEKFLVKNHWKGNHWDDRNGLGAKTIHGFVGVPLPWNQYNMIKWFNFDWHPAREPYDIPIPEVPT